MSEASWREQICREESKGGDVSQIGGVVLRLGGEVAEGCAGIDGGGEGEEGGQRNRGDGGGYALQMY